MRIKNRINAVVLGVALGASGCLLSAEAEFPEVDVIRQDVKFEAAPGIAGDQSQTVSFDLVHARLDPPSGLRPELHATEVVVTARSGVTDLSFVRTARLTMNVDSGNAVPVEIVSYQHSGGSPTGADIHAPCNQVDISDKWRSEKAVFTLEVAGQMPQRAWSVDVTVRFSGRVEYQP